MNFEGLLNQIRQQGIKLSRRQDKLSVYHPSGHLSPELAQAIRDYKPQLLEWLLEIKHWTIADFPLATLEQQQLDQLYRRFPTLTDLYPTTPLQEGLLLHHQFDQQHNNYVTQFWCQLVGHLDLAHFTSAWRQLVQRHDIFRTAFVFDHSHQPLQVVLSEVDLPLTRIDWQQKNSTQQQQDLQQLLLDLQYSQFDLTHPPLMQLHCLQLSADRWQFIWTHHHVLLDGWSLPLVINELTILLQQSSASLPAPVRYQYYLQWLSEQNHFAAQQFWQQQLTHVDTPTVIPGQQLPHITYQPGIAEHRFSLPLDLSNTLQALVKELGVSMNVLMQYIWGQCLARYLQTTEVIVGIVLSGRPPELVGSQHIIGLLINTVPLKMTFDAQQPLVDALQQLQHQNQQLMTHGFLPLAELQQISAIPSGQTLFDSLFIFENYPINSSKTEQQAFALQDFQYRDHNHYPLTVTVHLSDCIHIRMNYQQALLSPAIIEQYAAQLLSFSQYLQQNIAVDQPFGYPALTTVPHLYQYATQSLPSSKINSVFQWVVPPLSASLSQQIAIIDGEKQITYAELQQEILLRAAWLQQQGIHLHSRVALFTHASDEMLMTVLALFALGAHYVPLDPSYPKARILDIILDSQPDLLLYETEKPSDLLATTSVPSALLGQIIQDTPTLPAYDNDQVLAYVIYTSGSTGKPKGVQVEHAQLIHCLRSFQQILSLEQSVRWLSVTPISFDIAILELLLPLTVAGCVVICPKTISHHGAKLHQLLCTQQITHLQATPATWQLLVQPLTRQALPQLTALTGGEALSTKLASQLLPQVYQLWNVYGPTEATIWAAAHLVQDPQLITLGQPLPDLGLWVVDTQLQPLPTGISGEILITGPNISRGYWQRDSLTKQRFVDFVDPQGQQQRGYLTGDAGRWLSTENKRPELQYLHRLDQQIKLNGFRIELAEIEYYLLQHALVQQAVVVIQGQSPNQALVAFIIASNTLVEQSHWQQLIQQELAQQLPYYMQVHQIHCLTELPLTPAGKIDRQTLSTLTVSNKIQQYTAPSNAIELTLYQLWQTFFSDQYFGIEENFFALGGNSLSALQLLQQVQQHYDCRLELAQFFEHASIQAMANYIQQQDPNTQLVAISPQNHQGPIPLSFSQQRLWFVHQFDGQSAQYNLVQAFDLVGRLKHDAFTKALEQLLTRHAILRTVYREQNQQVVQVIESISSLPLTWVDLTEYDLLTQQHQLQQQLELAAQTSFDLTQAPLLKVQVYQLASAHYILLFNVHHIAADGWSMTILINEFVQLYQGISQQQPVHLPPIHLEYKDYALWQRQQQHNDLLVQQLIFWKHTLADCPPLLTLPYYQQRPTVQSYVGAQIPIQLPLNESQQLLHFAKQQQVTLFMLLIGAWGLLLSRLSNQETIVTGTPTANRNQAQLDQLVGCFINMLPIKFCATADLSVNAWLAQVKQIALNAFAHQDLPFEQIVEGLQVPRSVSYSPIFQTAFVLQNQPQAEFILPDVELAVYPLQRQQALFDLTLSLQLDPEQNISGSLQYNTQLFSQQQAQQFVQRFTHILQRWQEDAEQSLAQSYCITPAYHQFIQLPHYIEHPGASHKVAVRDAWGLLCEPGRFGELIYEFHDKWIATGWYGRWALTGRELIELSELSDWIDYGQHQISLQQLAQAIEQLPSVDSLAIDWQEESKQLVVYCVPIRESDRQQIEAEFKQHIVDYMHPSQMVCVQEIPRLTTGEIDFTQLTPFLLSQPQQQFPQTDIEQQLASLWQELLNHTVIYRDDNFFDLGGDSILSTVFIAQAQQLGFEFSVLEVFESPTIAQLAQLVQAQITTTAIQPRQNSQPPMASFAQQRLWFIHQLEGSLHYHIPLRFSIKGNINVNLLSKAWLTVVSHHRSLCTLFVPIEDNDIIPKIVTLSDMQIYVHDYGTEATLVQRHLATPFDLSTELPWRIDLIREQNDQYHLWLTVHHIAADGWSMAIIIRDLAAVYQQLIADQGFELPTTTIDYLDYALYQQQWLASDEAEKELKYWQQQLANLPNLHQLPTDFPRPQQQSFRGGIESHTIEGELLHALQQQAKAQQMTLFMLLQSSFALLLGKLSQQQDIVMATPVSGRQHAEVQELVGLFLNTLVLRSEITPTLSLQDFIQQNKTMILTAYDHQTCPFEMIVEQLQPQRSLSHSPLFQILMVMQNVRQESITLPDMVFTPEAPAPEFAKFDLELSLYEQENTLFCDWQYNTDLWQPETIRAFHERWIVLLKQYIADPQQRIHELSILTTDDKHVLTQWSQPSPAANSWVHSLLPVLQQQSIKHQQKFAAQCDGQQLTYQQLWSDSTIISQYILAWKQKLKFTEHQEVGIGIIITPNVQLITAIVSILRAGCFYVPLDPQLPTVQLNELIEQAQLSLILTSAIEEKYSTVETEIITIDSAIQNQPTTHYPESKPTREQLAYLIFTSGTTGRAKGVMVSHQSLVDYCLHAADCYYHSNLQGSWLMLKTSFDASLPALFLPLLKGHCVHMASEWLAPEQIWQPLAQQKHPLLVRLTPSHTELLPQEFDQNYASSEAHQFIIGGENLTSQAVKYLTQYFPNATIINHYGPTEAIIGVTCQPITSVKAPIHLGHTFGSVQGYIIDEYEQLVPPGCIGELVVSRDALARGYWQQPEQTAVAFIPNPFSTKPGERLYRTGDMVRLANNQKLQFIGRRDYQVKYHGYRLDLLDLEQRLNQHPQSRNAIILLHQQQLIACIQGESDVDVFVIQQWYQTQVASYAQPQHWLNFEQFPTNAHGKLDRRELLSIAQQRILQQQQQHYVAPTRPIEEQWLTLWKEVLGMETMGVEDNFFALGGDSILSIQLISTLRRAGFEVQVRDLFQYQSIRQLLSFYEQQPSKSLPAIAQQPSEGKQRLLPIAQQFFRRIVVDTHYYNQGFLLSVPHDLNQDFLQSWFRAFVIRHDVLRLAVVDRQAYYVDIEAMTLEHAVQVVTLSDQPVWQIRDQQQRLSQQSHATESAAITEFAEQVQASFDLTNPPLMRLVLIKGKQPRLLWVAHHLLVDGVSWRIALQDLIHAWTTQSFILAPKTESFQTYSEQLYQQDHRTQRTFWLQQFTVKSPYWEHTSLQRDQFLCDKELTAWLLRQTQDQLACSTQEVLLTSAVLALQEVTQLQYIRLYLESHGRVDLGINIDETLGWFTTIYPLLFSADPQDSVTALRQIKQTLAQVEHQGVGFGVLTEWLASEDEQTRQLQQLADHDQRIVFNYLGQFDQSFDQQSGFAFSPESIGETHSLKQQPLAALAINALVVADQLSVHLTSQVNIDLTQFAHCWLTHLQQLQQTQQQALTHHDLIATCTEQEWVQLQQRYPNIKQVYPLTPMQQGLRYHGLLAEDSDYIVRLQVVLQGALHLEHFVAAWRLVLTQQPIFRSVFTAQQHIELTELPILIDIDRYQEPQFNFDYGPLCYLSIQTLTEQQYKLTWVQHHILLDGWSNSLLFAEVLQTYQQLQQQQIPQLTPAVDWAHYWQWRQQQSDAQAINFWKQQLGLLTQETALLLAQPTQQSSPHYQQLEQKLSLTQTKTLVAYTKQRQTTVNNIIQLAWGYVLHRYSQQATIAFGATLSGRPAQLARSEQCIGLMITTIPVVMTFTKTLSITAAIQQQHQLASERDHYSYLGLAPILALSPINDPFQSLVVFENYPIDEVLQQPLSELSTIEFTADEQTHYPLTLTLSLDEQLSYQLTYQQQLFHDEDIQQLLTDFYAVLQQIIQAEQPYWFDFHLPSTPTFIDWQAPQPIDAFPSMIQCLQQQVQQTPQRCALRDSSAEKDYLYQQLWARSGQLMTYLQQQGVTAQDCLAIELQRGARQILVIIAIWRLGASFLPLDQQQPLARRQQMIHQAQVALPRVILLTDKKSTLQVTADKLIYDPSLWAELPESTDSIDYDPNQLAYILFTSGTTGVPKGIKVQQGSLSAFSHQLTRQLRTVKLPKTSTWAWLAPVTFDAALQGISQLCSGMTLAILPEAAKIDSQQLLPWLQQYQPNIIDITPSLLRHWLAQPQIMAFCQNFIVGGEMIDTKLWQALHQYQQHSNHYVWNAYGPSEATVEITLTQINEQHPGSIGHALGHCVYQLLDSEQRPVPDGVLGELCIQGHALSAGYFDTEATAAAFIHINGNTHYRTGDYMRRLKTGEVIFVQRQDQQIKYRGYRIDLAEIQQQILAVDSELICHVALIDQQLVAFIQGSVVQEKIISEHLQQHLPHYMLPSRYCWLHDWPLTENNKLDQRALQQALQQQNTPNQWLSPFEASMATIWQDILHIQVTTQAQDFLELGGHSLHLLTLIERIRQQWQVQLSLSDVLTHSRLEQITTLVQHYQQSPWQAFIHQQTNKDHTELAPELWAFPGIAMMAMSLTEFAQTQANLVHLANYPGFAAHEVLPAHLEELLEQFLAEIQNTQSTGPYYIAGHSFGGMIAFEIACRLANEGHPVQLALWDSSLLPLTSQVPIEQLQHYPKHLQGLYQQQYQYWLTYKPQQPFTGKVKIIYAEQGRWNTQSISDHLQPYFVQPLKPEVVPGDHLSFLQVIANKPNTEISH